jgi:putative addiction module component (TIGR02574 family)
MMTNTEVLKNALRLPPKDRFEVVEGLLESLDKPDPAIDEIWANEAERRLLAYREGRLGFVSEEEVFGNE